MSSPDHSHRDNARRRARQAWDRAGWNGPGWNGRGWYNGSEDESGSAGRESWSGNWRGDWREAGRDTPHDRRQDGRGQETSGRGQDSAGRGDSAASAARSDVPRKRVRIGDAERDRAVSMLSEHFVAGRLTQGEFEERSEQVTRARYSDDIEPVFDDLPAAAEVQVAQPSGPVGVRRAGPPPLMMIAPFLMIGLVVSSIALTAPWLLWGLFWIVLLSGMGRHHGPRFHR